MKPEVFLTPSRAAGPLPYCVHEVCGLCTLLGRTANEAHIGVSQKATRADWAWNGAQASILW